MAVAENHQEYVDLAVNFPLMQTGYHPLKNSRIHYRRWGIGPRLVFAFSTGQFQRQGIVIFEEGSPLPPPCLQDTAGRLERILSVRNG